MPAEVAAVIAGGDRDVRRRGLSGVMGEGDGTQSMSDLILNGIKVEDTFAEAFDVAGTAIIVTNDTPKWAMIAAAWLARAGALDQCPSRSA